MEEKRGQPLHCSIAASTRHVINKLSWQRPFELSFRILSSVIIVIESSVPLRYSDTTGPFSSMFVSRS